MNPRLRAPYNLSLALGAIMVAQSLLGLAFPDQYRDVEWIKATWFGNDWVTLVLAVPLLFVGLTLVRRDSARGALLWFGMLGYAAYNYAYYMLGAALNAFFPLYIAPLVIAASAIVLALSRTDVVAVAASFRPGTPVRALGGYLTFVAVGLTAVWMGTWAAYAFAGKPTPLETEAFKLVAALDVSIMVTALATGGILLWRRSPWGYVVASMAAIQGALYLLVLSVNSTLSILRGLTKWPGELPIWGALCAATTAAAVVLLLNAGRTRASAVGQPGSASSVR